MDKAVALPMNSPLLPRSDQSKHDPGCLPLFLVHYSIRSQHNPCSSVTTLLPTTLRSAFDLL